MKIFGILNATPDSFFPDSRVDVREGIEKGLAMSKAGADVLDIGGESTRPGADYVDAEVEIQRVVPLIRGLKDSGFSKEISIDTRKFRVAEAAVQAGATWVNDVSALEDDEKMGPFVAESGMNVVLMHRQGHSKEMQNEPKYRNVEVEVREYLLRRIDAALAYGIRSDRIWIDPGIGFGKTIEHNLQLLRALPELTSLGFPVFVGLSRKSFLGKLTQTEVEDRLVPSVVAGLFAALQGAKALRVHDVSETVQALEIWSRLTKAREDLWIGS